MTTSSYLSRRLLLTTSVAAACTALEGLKFPAMAANGRKPLVGATLLSLQYPFLVSLDEAMKSEATKKGIELITLDPRQSVATELNQVEDLVTRKVDLVVMIPVDQRTSQNAARLVNKAGIPLILVNTKFTDDFTAKGGTFVSYVGSDDTQAGQIEGQYLADQLPQGGAVIYLVGQYGGASTERRKAGFDAVVRTRPGLKIVTELQAHGSRAEAKTITENLLQRYRKGSIQALVAQNDEMAIGASSAIAAAGRLDEFKVLIGVDGSKAGLDAVKDGRMTATVFQDAIGQGTQAVDVASAILSKNTVPTEIIIPFKLVTKNNVASF